MAAEVSNKKIILWTSLLATLVSGFLIFVNPFPANNSVDLSPIPYTLDLPREIASKISVTSTSSPAGITRATIYYQPTSGEKVQVAWLTFTSLAEYDAHAAVDEVPLYGFQLKRENGMNLSVKGPQEPQFTLGSKDNQVEQIIDKKIYLPDLYKAK